VQKVAGTSKSTGRSTARSCHFRGAAAATRAIPLNPSVRQCHPSRCHSCRPGPQSPRTVPRSPRLMR
jgi:hypothetical protein